MTELPQRTSYSAGDNRFHGHRRLPARLVAWLVLLLALVVLAVANTREVKVDWVVGSTDASLVWVILAAALAGLLLGLITPATLRYKRQHRR